MVQLSKSANETYLVFEAGVNLSDVFLITVSSSYAYRTNKILHSYYKLVKGL
jgi:hypothetical protein